MSDIVEPSIDDYELLCVIGKGVFGKIYLVRELKSGQVYAMKVVKKKLIEKQNKLKYIFT
jgi:serine/threonine protein kinase